MSKVRLLVAQLAENISRAHHGVLAVGAGFALEAEGVLEVEGDGGRAREFQQEIAQRADGDGVRDGGALHVGRVRVALIHFGARGGFQAVEQIVGFHAEAFAAADFDVRLLRVFLAQRVAEFGGAARRERHNFVGKMNRAVGLFFVAERAQARGHDILQIRLPRVDHVVHDRGAAKCGRARNRLQWQRWTTACGRRDRCKISRSENRARAIRISRAGRRCPCRRR